MSLLAAVILLSALGLWLALCIADRYLAVAAFCALLPVYLVRFEITVAGARLVLPTTLLELLFWILFFVWLSADGTKKGAWRSLDRWAAPITLFAVGATVGAAISPDLRGALGLWRAYVLEPILFFPLLCDVLAARKRGTLPFAALGATLAVVGAIACLQKATGIGIPNPVWQAAATRRVTAFYGFPNAIGLFSAPVTLLMAGWTVAFAAAKEKTRRPLAALTGLAALLGSLGIVFAVSQGAMVGAAAGLVALGLLDRRTRAWTLGLIIAASLATMLVRPIRDEISILASLRDDSGSVRQIIWKETAAMLAEHPVFGAGLAGYRERIVPYHAATYIEVFMYPHDLFLNFWSETGLLGLAGFLWIVGLFFVETGRLLAKKQAAPWPAAALAAAMVALLVHGLVDVPYFKNDLAMLFWIIVGFVEVLRRLSEDARAAQKDANSTKSGPTAYHL